MRKLLVIALVCALLAPVGALAASFSETLFDNAKQALTLLSYGEYKKALKKLDMGNGHKASELSDFVENDLPDLPYADVQTDVAVAYHYKNAWRLAIPIETPSYDAVETFLLRSKDGKKFDAYKAVTWYDVLLDIEEADTVIWRDEYAPGDLFIIADDGQ